jgi:hydrophobic/amphiphilic exporter-1 (mainly G- bacteria), HAE1 family
VTTDLQIAAPQVNVEIDRDKAAALGVTPQQIENGLYDAFGERQASTIYADVAEYWVVFEVLPQFQRDPTSLAELYIASSVTGTNGMPKLIPLGSVAKLTRTVGPTSISHIGQLPAVTVTFNLAPGVSLGTAVSQVQKIESDLHLPATVTGSFQGTAAVFQSSQAGLLALLIVSIVIIYIILGILYESFVHPLTILSGLPSAGFGALLTLMVFGIDLNIYGFVGLIMLVGIVKKNAIMMIDFAIVAQRDHGKNAYDAIHEGCLLRFRPIMMTTMCALMATLPIALGLGAGGEARRALGLTVVGGLVVSQCLTLFITPVVYLYLENFQEWMTRKRGKKSPVIGPGRNPAKA